DGRLGVILLPIGLVFQDPGVFRAGEALALVGEPVSTAEALSVFREDPEAAARQLTERLGEGLRGRGLMNTRTPMSSRC
ncbi:MAG TPA: hypothetical protein VN083_06425, partial [Vicinamibacteria bacterium]|nr:hypothetical protein [Vicinamibacteria bacterium]